MFLEERTHLFYDDAVPEVYHKHPRGCTRGFSAVHVVNFKKFDIWPNRKIVSFIQHPKHMSDHMTKPDISIETFYYSGEV